MGLTEENKKYILNEYLRNISHIASKEYQQRVWIRAEGPEVDDFDETVCHFFDDGDPILDKYKEYNISNTQNEILNRFRELFISFVDGDHPYLPEDFIDTPAWNEITNLAKEVLKAFDYPDNND